jgi:hypothetical protein
MAWAKMGFEMYADCLMRHHFHLVVEMPSGILLAGMRWWRARQEVGYAVKLSSVSRCLRGGFGRS